MATDLTRRQVLGLVGGAVGVGVVGLKRRTVEATLRGQFRHFDVSASIERRGDDTPLGLSVAVPDSKIDPGDPARLEFTFKNESDGWIPVGCAPPPPFGVLRVRRVSDDTPLVLWTDRYIEAGGPDGGAGIITEGKWAKDVANDVGAELRLEPRETQMLAYTLHAETRNLAPGTYETQLVHEPIEVEERDVEGKEDRTTHGNPDYHLTVQITKR